MAPVPESIWGQSAEYTAENPLPLLVESVINLNNVNKDDIQIKTVNLPRITKIWSET